MSGFDDGAVASNVGHRTQNVKRLRARDTRNRIHRQRGDWAAAKIFNEFGLQRRAQQAYERRTGVQPIELLGRGGIHAEDDVRTERVADNGTGSDIRFIGVRRLVPRTCLNDNVITKFAQLTNSGRGCRNARLTRLGFREDSDFHCAPALFDGTPQTSDASQHPKITSLRRNTTATEHIRLHETDINQLLKYWSTNVGQDLTKVCPRSLLFLTHSKKDERLQTC